MQKKKAKMQKILLPREPMIAALGLAAIMRDRTYDVISQALEQAKWLGKSQTQIEKTLRSRGEKEYARLIRDVERTLDASMRRMKKPIKKKK